MSYSILNAKGRLFDLQTAKVMGILNLTPDSFSDGGKYNSIENALFQTQKMIAEGADIIDIGGQSTRPGAKRLEFQEEMDRVLPIIETLLQHFPATFFSIDTFHSQVAQAAISVGVSIVNDISGGLFDPQIFQIAAQNNVIYILSHIQGTPETMQIAPNYENVVDEIMDFFVLQVRKAHQAGLYDIVLDPGFGFGKTLDHNYTILRKLEYFNILHLPVMIGISKKSMLSKIPLSKPAVDFDVNIMHYWALQKGAKILRVHDVAPAVRTVQLFNFLTNGN